MLNSLRNLGCDLISDRGDAFQTMISIISGNRTSLPFVHYEKNLLKCFLKKESVLWVLIFLVKEKSWFNYGQREEVHSLYVSFVFLHFLENGSRRLSLNSEIFTFCAVLVLGQAKPGKFILMCNWKLSLFFQMSVTIHFPSYVTVEPELWSFLYFPSCFPLVDPMGDDYSGSGGKCVYCVVL